MNILHLEMKKLIPLLFLSLLFSCSDSAETKTQTDSGNKVTPPPANTNSNSGSAEINANLDSAVRGYITKEYNLIDSFSAGKEERVLTSSKSFIRASFKFDQEKIFYNTGVKTEKFTAVIAGFNTGNYQLENAPMDGLVVRMIPQNGYWFIQANAASGYIHERMTVDVLFIRNDQVETIVP